MKYSIVVILDRQRPDVAESLGHLSSLFSESGRSHEIVLVTNGVSSTYLDGLDFSAFGSTAVKLVEFTRHVTSGLGLSGALPHCQGEAIVTCAPYRQLTDEAVLSLLATFEKGADMVIPWRQNRVDPDINQLQSRLYNRLVQKTTKTVYHDLSCPFRIFRKTILDHFHLYGDLYRYLPIMAGKYGFHVVEEPCGHLAEEGETGLYSLREYIGRLVDFLTFHFDLYSSRKPLRYFGKRALYFLLPGLFLLICLLAGGSLGLVQIGNSPWLILSLVLLLVGSMLWGVGLLGEVVTFALGRKRKEYYVDRMVGE